ncbi:DUF4179 domain-containing protein [Saccharibacillus sacchari]|uniref:DUF4179 domain-containing protein n=1 Tax=Saccharibacillus sacchari TaxID=456493 RepID=A0ACC6PEF4_9BACL
MSNHEEQKLLHDAEQSERESRTIGSMELNEAVRQGIGKGKQRVTRRRAVYGTGVFTATAAAIIALSASLLPGAGAPNESPAPSAVTAGVPNEQAATEQSEDVPKENIADYANIGMDSTLNHLIQGGYMNSLSEKVEQDGYTLTLRGEAMDDRKMYVAFSLANDTDQPVTFNNTEVDFGADAYTKWISTYMGENGVLPAGADATFFAEIELSGGTDYPQKAVFRTTVTPGEFGNPTGEGSRIEIPFNAHPDTLKTEIRTTEVNGELTVGGQKIEVSTLETSPLGVYVDYAADESNDKQVFELIDPVLKIASEDGSQIADLHFTAEQSKGTLTFEPTGIEDPASIDFTIAGISAADTDRTLLVVDTTTGEIVEGDEAMSVAVDSSGKELTFERKVETSSDDGRYIPMFQLSDTFTDAAGTEHQLISKSGYRDEADGTSVDKLIFELDGQAIQQPAAFRIEKFWEPIWEPAELKIK